jgi:hypothetical protein
MSLRGVISLLSGVALAACSVVGIRSGTEEPAYTVVQQISPSLQIRQYGARLAAQTDVPGDEIAARSEGFRRLAGYIFGANQGAATIAMTASTWRTRMPNCGACSRAAATPRRATS